MKGIAVVGAALVGIGGSLLFLGAAANIAKWSLAGLGLGKAAAAAVGAEGAAEGAAGGAAAAAGGSEAVAAAAGASSAQAGGLAGLARMASGGFGVLGGAAVGFGMGIDGVKQVVLDRAQQDAVAATMKAHPANFLNPKTMATSNPSLLGQFTGFLGRVPGDVSGSFGSAASAVTKSAGSTIAPMPAEIGTAVSTIGRLFMTGISTLPIELSGAINTAISSIGHTSVTDIAGLPGEVSGGIGSAFAAIGGAINGALNHLPGEIPTQPNLKLAVPSNPMAPAGGVFHRTSVPGTGGYLNSNLIDTAYIPSRRSSQQGPFTGDVYLDSRKVGKVIGHALAKQGTHPTQAPYPDGLRGYQAPDMQMTST